MGVNKLRQEDWRLASWQRAAIDDVVSRYVDFTARHYFSPWARFQRWVYPQLPVRLQVAWVKYLAAHAQRTPRVAFDRWNSGLRGMA